MATNAPKARPMPLATTVVLMISLAVLLFFAVFGDIIWGDAARTPSPYNLNAPPSVAHLLGTDGQGRDILSRVLAAAPLSIGMAVAATLLGATLGIVAGAVPVIAGARTRRAVATVLSAWLAFPTLIIALFVAIAIGPGVPAAILAVAIGTAPYFGRLVQTMTAQIENADYFASARMLGISSRRRFFRYLLPNIAEPIVAYVAISMSAALLAMSALSFLGVGVQPPGVDWGRMIGDGLTTVYTSPWGALGPGAAIVGVGLVFGAVGEWLSRHASGASVFRLPSDRPTQAQRDAPERSRDASSVIAAKGLSVWYPKDGRWNELVSKIDLTIRHGEIVGLAGESGSGKTLTAMALAGLTRDPGVVTAEALELDGVSLRGLDDRAMDAAIGSRIAVVFQDPSTYLNPVLSIGTQLTEGVVAAGMSRADAHARAVRALAALRVHDAEAVMRKRPFELSGGLRQRVLIAMTQMTEPSLLIADEPTTALDMSVQRDALRMIRERCDRERVSALLVSHDIGVLAEWCDRIIVMRGGRIVDEVAARRIHDQGNHPYTRHLVRSYLTLETDVDAPIPVWAGSKETVA